MAKHAKVCGLLACIASLNTYSERFSAVATVLAGRRIGVHVLGVITNASRQVRSREPACCQQWLELRRRPIPVACFFVRFECTNRFPALSALLREPTRSVFANFSCSPSGPPRECVVEQNLVVVNAVAVNLGDRNFRLIFNPNFNLIRRLAYLWVKLIP